MSDDVYRKLAGRLDAIPNGYPSTESGVELRLLERLFTPEEAALAAVMRLSLEKGDKIARRAGVARDEACDRLKAMADKGLIRARERKGVLRFALMPFVVGIYEESLPRLDTELAALFEQYYLETQAGITRDTPALHRVVPVQEAVPVELEVFPYERATELVESAKSWGVRDCICRVQQNLVGKGCDHPVENCLTFAPVEGAFNEHTTSRPISKQEALDILHEAEIEGLVHSTGNYRDGVYYICNCCTCACGILRGLTEFDIPTAVARSDFLMTVDGDLCTGCTDCVERCQFGALSVPDGVCEVAVEKCLGCGVCAMACFEEALHLERRAKGEVPTPPRGIKDWMLKRASDRDISIFDVL